MIELYEAYADYKDIMSMTENLLLISRKRYSARRRSTTKDKKSILRRQWRRVSMVDAIKEVDWC